MKEELTFEKAKENKFTMIDVVKYYFPNYDDKTCDYIIWEKTCFPMSTDIAFRQIYEIYLKSKDKTEQSEVNNT